MSVGGRVSDSSEGVCDGLTWGFNGRSGEEEQSEE